MFEKDNNNSTPIAYHPDVTEVVADSVENVETPSNDDGDIEEVETDVEEPPIVYDGEIIIEVVDENNELVIQTTIGFFDGDTDLIELLKTEYPVYCGNAQYEPDELCETNLLFGRTVLGIDDVITDWYNSFMAIYVNDTYSFVGVDAIEFVDGDVIRFVYTSLG